MVAAVGSEAASVRGPGAVDAGERPSALHAIPPRIPYGYWKRRSSIIRALRLILPCLIVAILAGMGLAILYEPRSGGRVGAEADNGPITLINPHFIGRDTQGRPFLLTAVSATRDPQDYQRVLLDRPNLVLDGEGPDPTHITAGAGVYHEDTGALEVDHHVRMSNLQGAFATQASRFDTKTGELVGHGLIEGAGPVGDIEARSYGVYDKGERMVFTGGVHTRIIPKEQPAEASPGAPPKP